MSNEIRFATNEDVKEVRALWDACFDEDSVMWRDWYFEYIYHPENTILLFEDDDLASMIQMNPYDMFINNKQVKAASLAGVATYEKYRKKGYAGKLIELGLAEMRKRGIVFSFLYPFNYYFYRKFGYELCYNRKIYKTQSNNRDDYSLIEIDDTYDVSNLYRKYCTDLNGYIVRNQDYMSQKIKEHLVDNNFTYLIKHNDNTDVGYCLLSHEDDGLVADELIVSDIIGVANAISGRFKMPIIFESPYDIDGVDRELKPHCMGRVIDIIKLFEGAKSNKAKVTVKVIDNIIDENNNTFLLDGTTGYLKITSTQCQADFTLDVKELAQIAVGFKQGLSENANEFYSSILHEKTPWIKEVC